MALGMSSRFIFWLALALCAAVGSDCLLGSAESLPISTYCVSADQCAALCRNFVEGDSTGEDFIRRAAFELGPAESFKPLPAPNAIPPVVDPTNVYSEVRAGNFSPAVADALPRIYSPNLITGKVDVIDPATFTVIDHFNAGASPQHIVPSWDLQTLWVTGDVSGRGAHGSLVPIDPKKIGRAHV